MIDALAVGFNPHLDYWITDDYHAITYCEPGRATKTVSKSPDITNPAPLRSTG